MGTCSLGVEKQDYRGKDSQSNAQMLEGDIRSLSSNHWAGIGERDYRTFWKHAREISQLFKTLKPLHRDDRDRLWKDFSAVCEDTKQKQTAKNDNRKFKSEQHRSDVLNGVERARPCSLFGFLPPDVEDMKALGRVLRDAGELLSKYKMEMFGEHKQECFQAIGDMRAVHDAWWEMLKGHRSQRQEDFQQRVRANLEKNYERHRKATDALHRVRAHADDLRDKISSAWNDDFRDRATEWLSEAEDKITDIENSIQEIEGWIHEDEQKLR